MAVCGSRCGVLRMGYKVLALLQLRAGAEVTRVQRLASGVAFILPVVIPDAVFAELPAQINFLVVHDGGKIQQADVEILDEAPGGEIFFRFAFITSARFCCSMRFSASFA